MLIDFEDFMEQLDSCLAEQAGEILDKAKDNIRHAPYAEDTAYINQAQHSIGELQYEIGFSGPGVLQLHEDLSGDEGKYLEKAWIENRQKLVDSIYNQVSKSIGR